MRKALKREGLPDKVPHGEVMIDDSLVERITGIKISAPDRNSNVYWACNPLSESEFQAHLRAREVLGCDFVVVFPEQGLRVVGRSEDGYQVVEDAWGRVFVLTADSIRVVRYPVERLEDLKGYHFPDVGKFTWENLKLWKNHSPLFVACQIDVGFSRFVDLIGFERLMFWLKDDRKAVRNFAQRFYGFAEEMAQKAIEEGAECVWLANDFAHNKGTFISPQDLWDLDLQFMKELVRSIRRNDFPIVLHACGRVMEVIELLLEVGIDALHALQPAAGNDIFLVKRKYGNKLTLIGNLDLNELLPFGNPWDIDLAVRELVEEIGRGGGYILSSCNSLTAAIPLENALIAHLACEKYGRICGDDSQREVS